jgi:predicted NAD/FAD-binding protein
MKIAIIGSGYFGSTIALILSKKHNVDLYEKEKDKWIK